MTSKKEKKKNRETSQGGWYSGLKDETKHSILAVFSLAFALFFTLAAFGKAGVLGGGIFKALEVLFGAGFFLVPTAFFLASISLFASIRPNFLGNTITGMALFLLSGLGAADIMFGARTGGYVGFIISWPFVKFFDFWVSLLLMTAVFIVSLLIMLNTSISIKLKKKEVPKEVAKKEEEEKEIPEEEAPKENEESELGPAKKIGQKIIASAKSVAKKTKKEDGEEELELETGGIKSGIDFTPPPLELLEKDKGKPSSGDIKANSNIIKRTLKNFGIAVEMGEINVGPSVTQYTLKPAEGIKLSRIVGLQNDLALALAAHPLRIEAPIPGRPLVGIEIPNSAKTIVGLATILAEDTFKNSPLSLLIALGKDVSGKSAFADLAKMPHLLIAGTTGAGKSICIHSIIINLLYRNSPESLRMIMIDPKRVELTIYNKIPHMLTPVITEPKKAILTLKWLCKEMDKRYDILLKAGVRDIESYHKKAAKKQEVNAESEEFTQMPYLVIVIDEMASLMNTYPREMESSIVRLAQMSRAVGIHLILSTQRPSVEVITGLIKANVPSRIALQVASQIDSRTILDMSGAEKLLGKGDMLFLAGDTAKPKRIQGPFISEKEVKRVVDYLAEEYKDSDIENINTPSEDELNGNGGSGDRSGQASIDLDFEDAENDDDLYEDAREMVIKSGKASASYMQRKLRVGYARAARLLDMLEERGVVSPADGSNKAREVLIKERNGDEPEENNSGF